MIAEYLRDLEDRGEIEFYRGEDKRIKFYRIKPNKKKEVTFKLDKQLLTDFIEGIEHIEVIHFLQDFTMELNYLYRGTEIRSDEDMKAIIEEAKEETFKLLIQ
jgi:hypothetical protein